MFQTFLAGRSPYGERGLKSVSSPTQVALDGSLSLRRAWIEISLMADENTNTGRSPYGERGLKSTMSRWLAPTVSVALLTESVD